MISTDGRKNRRANRALSLVPLRDGGNEKAGRQGDCAWRPFTHVLPPEERVPQRRSAEVREAALEYLRTALGDPAADFRDGQWECIERVVNGGWMLVVQRTGWGKNGVLLCGPLAHQNAYSVAGFFVTARRLLPPAPRCNRTVAM